MCLTYSLTDISLFLYFVRFLSKSSLFFLVFVFWNLNDASRLLILMYVSVCIFFNSAMTEYILGWVKLKLELKCTWNDSQVLVVIYYFQIKLCRTYYILLVNIIGPRLQPTFFITWNFRAEFTIYLFYYLKFSGRFTTKKVIAGPVYICPTKHTQKKKGTIQVVGNLLSRWVTGISEIHHANKHVNLNLN
jgi:hypothetical protein